MIDIIDNSETLPSMARRQFSPRFIKISLGIIIVIILSFIWFVNTQSHLILRNEDTVVMTQQSSAKTKQVEKFSNDVLHYEDFKRVCYHNAKPTSIEDLSTFVNMLKNRKHLFCQHNYRLFQLIYQIRVKYTTIAISKPFMLKVKKWLHDDETLIQASKNQSLIFVDNLYTQESVVFNPVRANRPGLGAGDTLKYVQKVVTNTKKGCDFCLYKNNTASDLFGRMESTFAVIISNTFKIEKYHGMALLKNHDPLNFTQMQFIDCMHLVMRWFRHVHHIVPSHLYRIMYWDILPKASASQVHPHIHLTLGDYAYYAKWNQLYKSGLLFSQENGHKNYWSSILQIHTSLGLTVTFGKASLMAYLTPQKDLEVVIISEKPCLDFFRLVFFTIRAFIDDLMQYALSMGFVFPKINADYHYGNELPMLVRILSRGPADSTRSDISSFDLFGTANVNKDPFKLIKTIRDSVMKQKEESFKFPQWNN